MTNPLPPLSLPNPLPLPTAASSTLTHMFAEPKTDKDVERERKLGIPPKNSRRYKVLFSLVGSMEATLYRVNWRRHGSPSQFSANDIQHWLTRFILEIWKQNSSVFTPGSLHHITAGLMRHLSWNGRPEIDLFRTVNSVHFHASLDFEMKRLQQQGVGATKRQANVLTESTGHYGVVQWSLFCPEKWKRAPPTAKHSVPDTGYWKPGRETFFFSTRNRYLKIILETSRARISLLK